jgi:hypothetical protein
MKKSLEDTMTTTATPEDLKVIEVIISRMTMFDSYYGTLTMLHSELQYREYTTLKDDFRHFQREIILNTGKYSIKELTSLKRSMMLLKSRLYFLNSGVEQEYFNFLENTCLSLDEWLASILEQITANV